MAKVNILSDFIGAFIKGGGSGIPNEKKLSKKELEILRDLKNADETEKIEWKLSSRIKASVSEKEAQKEAKAKQRTEPFGERARDY